MVTSWKQKTTSQEPRTDPGRPRTDRRMSATDASPSADTKWPVRKGGPPRQPFKSWSRNLCRRITNITTTSIHDSGLRRDDWWWCSVWVVWPAVAVAGVCVPHTVLLHRLWLLVATRCQDGPCMQCMQVLVGSRGVTLIQSFRQEISQSTHGRTLHVLQLEWRAAKFTLVILLGECSRTSPQKKKKKCSRRISCSFWVIRYQFYLSALHLSPIFNFSLMYTKEKSLSHTPLPTD